jgi:hypothetical protein
MSSRFVLRTHYNNPLAYTYIQSVQSIHANKTHDQNARYEAFPSHNLYLTGLPSLTSPYPGFSYFPKHAKS